MSQRKLRYLASGALAGTVAVLAFMTVHAIFISNIWFSTVAMIAAGAVSGACVAWTYALLVPHPSVRSWVRYNLVYMGIFVALGVCSVLVFDPVTTIAALIQAKAPPTDLFARAMPMTLVFLVAITITLSMMYGRQWHQVAAILVTCSVLLALLGLNVSAIGLVDVPRGSLHLIAELFGLILVLDAVYAAAFTGLQWRTLGPTVVAPMLPNKPLQQTPQTR